MKNVLSIFSSKGGVGKTTTAINLGIGLRRKGHRVLLIDFDPTANLTRGLGQTPANLRHTISAAMRMAIMDVDELEQTLEKSIFVGIEIDFIPANTMLAQMPTQLTIMQNQISFSTEPTVQSEYVLKTVLEPLQDKYDYILIDCGRGCDILTVNALTASQSVIIPVQAHFYAGDNLPETLAIIDGVRQRYNPQLVMEGILITMLQAQTNFGQGMATAIRETFGEQHNIFPVEIPYTIATAEQSAHATSIFKLAASNKSAFKSAAAYERLANEVLACG